MTKNRSDPPTTKTHKKIFTISVRIATIVIQIQNMIVLVKISNEWEIYTPKKKY